MKTWCIYKNCLALGLLVMASMGLNSCKSISQRDTLKKTFIFKDQGKYRLAVWMVHERLHGKSGVKSRDRMMSFDLDTGVSLGDVDISPMRSGGSYSIYWSGGDKAWSMDDMTGLRLLSLGRPAVLADRGKILASNPELGGSFRVVSPVYDNETHLIHVRGKKGDYALDYSLKLRPYRRSGKYLAFHKLKWKFTKQWVFRYAKGSIRELVHAKGSELDAKAVELLYPKFVPEFNLEEQGKKDLWLKHQSALHGQIDILMSLVTDKGAEINRLNLTRLFPNGKIKVLGTYTRDSTVFLLIGTGENSRKHVDSIDVHTLSALRVDRKTGRMLERVVYF